MKSTRAKPDFPVRPIQARMIAPCGMNCALCIGHLREKNRCPGCNDLKRTPSSTYCRKCRLRNCTEQGHPNRFCGECAAFPCRRLRQLDHRHPGLSQASRSPPQRYHHHPAASAALHRHLRAVLAGRARRARRRSR